ncbi:hypothetical protein IV203_009920 [Nitzschia inconspicua]|uniref:Uncharacterized protein n=1 Tax=Nitzschia inconspicua TaxID=303405 RepID=A0A9K3PKD5_9STRA|nr:hypothetical protein IV203_009920 [Nitzschia inconspicua]
MSTTFHEVQRMHEDRPEDDSDTYINGGTDNNIILSMPCDTDTIKREPLWLVLESFQNIEMGIDKIHQERGALLSSTKSRDAYIQWLVQKTQNNNCHGYTVSKVSNLDELRQLLQTQAKRPMADNPSSNHSEDSHRTFTPTGLDEVKRFELFREIIDHEDDLLNQRVSWIILAQSFLMAAFISAASNVDNRSFLYITAAVGLATVIVTLPALIAAGQNIELQQRVYFLGLESDEQCQRLHGHDRDAVLKSPNELIQRTTKGHVFPNTAYRGRYGIPILKTVMALAFVQVAGWCGLLISLVMEW